MSTATAKKPEPVKGKKPTLTPEQRAAKAAKKAAKFNELAQKRMTKAIKAVRLLGNLANYVYTAEHVNRVQAALHDEVMVAVKRLEGGLNKGTPGAKKKERFEFKF